MKVYNSWTAGGRQVFEINDGAVSYIRLYVFYVDASNWERVDLGPNWTITYQAAGVGTVRSLHRWSTWRWQILPAVLKVDDRRALAVAAWHWVRNGCPKRSTGEWTKG